MADTTNTRVVDPLAQAKAKIDADVAKANAAYQAGNLTEYNSALAELVKHEEEYREGKTKCVYDDLLTQELPINAAIMKYSFPIVKHREIKDNETHTVIGIETVERDRQIDLLRFCKYGKLNEDWQYTVQKFNQLLCLRAAKELGFSAAQVKGVVNTFFMQQKASEENIGGTPASNNQVCKLLQKVIDGIVFNDDGNGNNTFKCNNHDVAYLLMCYTKLGKGRLGIAIAKHDFLRRLIMNVCYRILTKGEYTLEYKVIKTKDGKEKSVAPTPEETAAGQATADTPSDDAVTDQAENAVAEQPVVAPVRKSGKKARKAA